MAGSGGLPSARNASPANSIGLTARGVASTSIEGVRPGPELSPEGEEGEVGASVGAGAGSGACPFLELEKKPLLKVFVFLSAPEVLRAAQVCRPMFRKARVSVCTCGAWGAWRNDDHESFFLAVLAVVCCARGVCSLIKQAGAIKRLVLM